MNIQEIQEKLSDLFDDASAECLLKFGIETFDELNMFTTDKGFVLTMPDGTIAHLTISLAPQKSHSSAAGEESPPPIIDYNTKTFVNGDASQGLLSFGVPCDLDAWLASPERVMRHVEDGITASEINRRRWGSYVHVRVDVEQLKACARRGLLRCEKGRWFILPQH